MSNQAQTTTEPRDQVTALLNYWEKILGHIWSAVELNAKHLAISNELSERRREALERALKLVDQSKASKEDYSDWTELSERPKPTPTMDELRNPTEEVVQ